MAHNNKRNKNNDEPTIGDILLGIGVGALAYFAYKKFCSEEETITPMMTNRLGGQHIEVTTTKNECLKVIGKPEKETITPMMTNRLGGQHIEVATTKNECLKVIGKINKDCKVYPVLGLDCEWVSNSSGRKPVALLQLATYTGFCALIRLCQFSDFPTELRALLEDNNILKVGVATSNDAKYLDDDHGLQVDGTLDLRYIAWLNGFKLGSLAKMSQDYLKFELDKEWCISDWEQPDLNDDQIKYAATDAHVGIKLFQHFDGFGYEELYNKKDWPRYRQFLNKNYFSNFSSSG